MFYGSYLISLFEVYRFCNIWTSINNSALIWPSDVPSNAFRTSTAHMVEIGDFHLDREAGRPMPLLKLINSLRGSNAKDPRDKISCMLPFASDINTSTSLLRPDYQSDYLAVCVRLVVWFINTYKTLDFLSLCWPSVERESETPRWCPDWDQRHASMAFQRLSIAEEYDSDPIYYASGRHCTLNEIMTPIHRGTLLLRVEGVFVSKIDEHLPLHVFNKQGDFENAIHAWMPQSRDDVCPLNGIPRESVLGCTVVADWTELTGGDTTRNKRGLCVDLEHGISFSHTGQVLSLLSPRQFLYAAPLKNESRGLMGLERYDIQAGDEVWLLEGGRMLPVLRRVTLKSSVTCNALDLTGAAHHEKTIQEGEDVFLYVGECFIMGLMEGQVLDMLGENPKRQHPECLSNMGKGFEKIYIA